MKYLSIDVGGTAIKYALVNDNQIVWKDQLPTHCLNSQLFNRDIQAIYQKAKNENLVGIAMSMPGILDDQRGYMYSGGSLLFIHNVNMTQKISQLCDGIPVSIENDAKAAARAEMKDGAVADCKDALILLVGTALGGTAISGGRILRGAHFFAGEYSFMSSNEQGSRHYDQILGTTCGVGSMYQEYAKSANISIKKVDGHYLFDRVKAKDKKAIAAVNNLAKRLAVVIVNMISVVDPSKIAIGGGISAQPAFIEAVTKQVNKILSAKNFASMFLPKPEIVACRYGNDANLLGAVLAFQQHYPEIVDSK